MGRKAIPLALHKLQGTYRPDRHNGEAPEPERGIPTCPKHLNKSAAAEYRRLARLLDMAGMLTKADRDTLAAYCIVAERWARAEEQIKLHGEIVKSPTTGTPMQNPWLGIANKALLQMQTFGSELGLSPSSRTKIKIDRNTEAAQADPMAALLGKISAKRIQENSERTGAL